MPTFQAPPQTKHDATQNSYLILKYAHDTAESLLQAFATVRRARGATSGAATHVEQDLLRAMVVFAGAGIDSMTKQLIRDALPVMVGTLPPARKRIEDLIVRHLRRGGTAEADDDATASAQPLNAQRLARVLLADTPRDGISELLVDDLTSGSLQSSEELYRILRYLGIKPESLGVDESGLRAVFDCRNKLIHEMDINFTQQRRNRLSRRRVEMVSYAQTLLQASNAILQGVDNQLSAGGVAQGRGRARRP